MTRTRGIRPLLLVIALVVTRVPMAHGCPSCKESMRADVDVTSAGFAQVGDGYSYSVLALLVLPAVLVTAGSFLVVGAAKKGDLPEL